MGGYKAYFDFHKLVLSESKILTNIWHDFLFVAAEPVQNILF